jgi:hypothetical protein
MREPHSEGLNLMNTRVISKNSLEAGWVGGPKAVGGCASFELVKAFGDRIYSIAKHITQNDDAAEDVLGMFGLTAPLLANSRKAAKPARLADAEAAAVPLNEPAQRRQSRQLRGAQSTPRRFDLR